MIFAGVLTFVGLVSLVWGPISGQLDIGTALVTGVICFVGAWTAWCAREE